MLKKIFKYYNLNKKRGYKINKLIYGDWGLQSNSNFFLKDIQLKSSLFILKKFLKLSEKYWVRVFNNNLINFKSLKFYKEFNKIMGKKIFISLIKKKKILFELSNISKKKVFFIFSQISFRISNSLLIIKKI